MKKEVTSHVVKGLVVALILVAFDVVAYTMGYKLESWVGFVWMGIFLAAIIWGVLNYGNQMNHNVTFGKLFMHGFKMSAVIACIWFVYTLLAVYLLFPEMMDQMWEKAMEDARKNPNYNEEQMQQGMAIGQKIMKVTVLAGAVLGPLIIGCIGALIGAAAGKKRPVAEFENV